MLARTTIADRFIASLQAGSYGLLHTLGKGIGNPTLRGDEMTAYMDHKNLANEVIDARAHKRLRTACIVCWTVSPPPKPKPVAKSVR